MLDVLLPEPLHDHLLVDLELVELEVGHLLGDGELEDVAFLVGVEGRVGAVELVLDLRAAVLGAQRVGGNALGLGGVAAADHLLPEQNGV